MDHDGLGIGHVGSKDALEQCHQTRLVLIVEGQVLRFHQIVEAAQEFIAVFLCPTTRRPRMPGDRLCPTKQVFHPTPEFAEQHTLGSLQALTPRSLPNVYKPTTPTPI